MVQVLASGFFTVWKFLSFIFPHGYNEVEGVLIASWRRTYFGTQ
jgi:hypothetical protein